MIRRVVILIALCLTAAGCRQPAHSQEQDAAPPDTLTRAPDDSARGLQDHIAVGRRNAITNAIEAASPAVVSINVVELQEVYYRDPFFSDPFFNRFFGRRGYQQVEGLGSGFVISADGYIVTNHHVAGKAQEISVSFYDGTTVEARLIGTDPLTDLALLKVDADEALPYLRFAQDDPIVGEWAIALGNPFGLFEAGEPTVTVGVVSAIGRDFEAQGEGVYRDMIQTDAAINRGNSGGPLVNALGEVLGVNTFIVTAGGAGGSIGLGFAVPSARVQRIVSELRDKGVVDRSYTYTGLYVRNVTERIARALGLAEPTGVIVARVDPDSPADDGGFRPYDVIVGIGTEPIRTRNDVAARLFDYEPGEQVVFRVIRDGQAADRSIRLRSGGTGRP